jgi:hypothetical protein
MTLRHARQQKRNAAAEATLLRSQRLGLGRGGSDPQFVTRCHPDLFLSWKAALIVRVQRLNGGPV